MFLDILSGLFLFWFTGVFFSGFIGFFRSFFKLLGRRFELLGGFLQFFVGFLLLALLLQLGRFIGFFCSLLQALLGLF